MGLECMYNKSIRKQEVDKLPSLSKTREQARSQRFTASALAVAERNTGLLLQQRSRVNCS